MTRARDLLASVHTEGTLLPPDLLQRVMDRDKALAGLRPEDYHHDGERLNELTAASWQRLQGRWLAFKDARAKLPEGDPGTTETRERWLLPLFQELDYGRLQTAKSVELGGRSYAVSHGWQPAPIHLVGCNVDLDRKTAGVAGAARTSPHSLVQEYLNRSDGHLWAFVSNGLRLRMLRDNVSLSRQAYVEFDLEAMMEGELYSDFVLLWLLCHQSRVEGERPDECWLEHWSQEAQQQGVRALDGLRKGVERAISALGSGFLDGRVHNAKLLEKLRDGRLDKQDYYRQLLRMVYRLLFLFTAEDRDLLLDPAASEAAAQTYTAYYSTERLRHLAERRRGSRHTDLFESLRLVMQKLGGDGCPELGLPPLGSMLFADESVVDLLGCRLANRDLLEAVRRLAFTEDGHSLRPIDFRNLGAEELGSVYESLLEMQPDLNSEAATFELRVVSGSERKTTGSYYTPSSLIQCLLDTALDPVVDERLKAASPDEREGVLLDLKVCDPACGSGHFLIAAAHRLARRLAAVRTGDDEPAPAATRQALRDVIGHCIYGVDINPMSVELCKVNLWIEALEPGKPLSFLDHRIQCGNSLLGVTPALLREGIPDEAFKPIKGDDRAYCAALRKRNKQERHPRDQVDGALGLFDGDATNSNVGVKRLAAEIAVIDGLDDDTVQQVTAKQARYAAVLASPEQLHARTLADLWCCAMVREKTPAISHPITEEVFRRIEEDPRAISPGLAVEVPEHSAHYSFFHWHLAFPDVCRPTQSGQNPTNVLAGWDGGFDLVLGNPPWERVKLMEQEFFAERDPTIASERNAAVRKKRIAALPETNAKLAAEWDVAARRSACESAFMSLQGRFPLGGVGDVNTYAVFADLFRQLVSPTGAAALLLPNGLVTGFTYRAFLGYLLETRTLASFYGFENEDKIFPDVHNETKFGILTMRGSERPVERPVFTAHVRQAVQTKDPMRRYALSAREIEAINPNTLNLPAFRRSGDADLTRTIHQAAPVLVRKTHDGASVSPWGVEFRRLFDMTNDARKFLAHDAIGPRVVERRGALARLDDGSEVYPLYEGKMLWHFDHRYGTYEGQTEKQANKGVLPRVGAIDHDDPVYRSQPRYWVAARDVDEALGPSTHEWFIAFRDVGPTERTFVASLMPRSAAGNKAPLMTVKSDGVGAAAFLAVISSLVVDYDARQRSNLMNFFVVEQLAVLAPELLGEPLDWLNGSAASWLADRVLELSYTNEELAPFARDLGCSLPPFRWIPERRRVLQAEIDAAVLHLYGLSRTQAEWLLDSFTVLRKYEERDYDEFMTRRVVLAIYDAMAQAIDSGRSYRTPLAPLPADARCCHDSLRIEPTV